MQVSGRQWSKLSVTSFNFEVKSEYFQHGEKLLCHFPVTTGGLKEVQGNCYGGLIGLQFTMINMLVLLSARMCLFIIALCRETLRAVAARTTVEDYPSQ